MMTKSKSLKAAMKRVTREDLAVVRKTDRVILRISKIDKDRLKRVASSCGLSLSEFLVQSATFAADHLERGNKK